MATDRKAKSASQASPRPLQFLEKTGLSRVSDCTPSSEEIGTAPGAAGLYLHPPRRREGDLAKRGGDLGGAGD